MQTERRPHGQGWEERDTAALGPRPDSTLARSAWAYGRVFVLSALENAELPDGSGIGPQWHISVSRSGRRPSEADVRRALRGFGMVGAEEDNHHPGAARHFWRPLDATKRVDCQCKEDETTVVEPDGYRWTNPTTGPCRGCEFAAALGRVCPLHPQGQVHG